MSSTSGHIHTSTSSVSITTGAFQTLAFTRITRKPQSSSNRGVHIELDARATGSIEIVAGTNQYVDFYKPSSCLFGQVDIQYKKRRFFLHVS